MKINGRLFLIANGCLAFLEELTGQVLSGMVGVLTGICEGLGEIVYPLPWDKE